MVDYSGPGDSKLEPLERLHVGFSQQENAMAEIDTLRKHGRRNGTARAGFFVGPSRSGKTRTAQLYMQDVNRGARQAGALTDPVLYITLPAECTPKSLNEVLLHAIRHPEPCRGTTTQLTIKAGQSLMARGVQLVIIDEIHHLKSLTTRTVGQKVAVHIKTFLNSTNVPMLFVGVPKALEIKNADTELNFRSEHEIPIGALDWWDKQQQFEFRAILDQFEPVLPFNRRSELDAKELAARIHFATGGLVGAVSDLIYQTAALALMRKRPCLTREDFADTYERQFGLTRGKKSNPFKLKTLPERWTPTGNDFGGTV